MHFIDCDKGSLDKKNINNFRPVNVLNCFSKIFGNVKKGQRMPFIENHLSVFLSAYRSSYIVHNMYKFAK